jgi:predicted esterase
MYVPHGVHAVTEIRTIEAVTHGRYLVETPRLGDPAPLLVGFHGYGELAEHQMERLRTIPGADALWLLSVQGLNRFYRGPSRHVVASWMTRQDRELAIADNLAYVEAVLSEVIGEPGQVEGIVFAGFSQGVAMAFRAACASTRRVLGVVALGGDVPPELDDQTLRRIPAVLIGRGEADDRYPRSQWERDHARLAAAGLHVRASAFEGGHDWTAAFSGEVGRFLSALTRRAH